MKEVDFKENLNCIKEISKGRYRIILDFATTGILKYLIRDNYKYVWVHNHTTSNGFHWQKYSLPIMEEMQNLNVLAKGLKFDFILTTEEFKPLMSDWKRGIEMIQLNQLPPDYLDLDKIKGNRRYELLESECDYLFEAVIPSATDYGMLVSPDRTYLQSLLDNPEIDWEKLP
ncbi:hypothetical protein [Pontibacter sp. SGAir0037]|uniref:hypothetical protein n=1 Tax=Pontibacter sp. SGAir0037 TaxID=2571030 RepID=UPI0010CCBBDC|nr:hypothetical protein [Pontibacter sp. SGAir0037]QCR22321.1 hypothetical protein C1N53_08210 [Pontibacter sp. SGAir0037]